MAATGRTGATTMEAAAGTHTTGNRSASDCASAEAIADRPAGNCATAEAIADRPAGNCTTATSVCSAVGAAASNCTASGIAISATVIAAAAIEATTAVPTMAVAAEPGTGADKDAAGKPVRAVIAVRRAGVRGIRVVAVDTGGSSAPIGRAAADADHHLRVCGRNQNQEKSERREKF